MKKNIELSQHVERSLRRSASRKNCQFCLNAMQHPNYQMYEQRLENVQLIKELKKGDNGLICMSI